MADPNPLTIPVLTGPAKLSGSIFNTREKLHSTNTSELVIALCGPIGSPIHVVADKLKDSLDNEFRYDKCEIIRLSQIIADHFKGKEIPDDEDKDLQYERINKLIELGDVLRKDYGNGILVEIAIGKKIAVDREQRKEASGSSNYEPARVCHIIDSIKNQEELDLLKDVYGDMLYCIGVFSPLPVREKNLEKRGMTSSQIHDLIDKDSGEEFAYGQTVRDTFPQADFFLRIDSDTDTKIIGRVQRFLHIILGTKIITPSKAEKAMYAAASAAGNSACLSRQVGAAITDEAGEILSTGWNDVPKFGGNLYGTDPVKDPASEADNRCWNKEGGLCFNDQEKRLTAELVVSDLVGKGFIDAQKREDAIQQVIKNSKLKNLIEFSRSIHAEMHAIILGSQLAGERVKNGKLFCTTYPCHSCARHIVAAGIKEVYYIEPYRKSLATKLHGDSISESETDFEKVRLLPYDGVAPTKYLKLFRMDPDSRKKDGKMPHPDPKLSRPRFDKSLEAFPALEAIVVDNLKRKKLIPEGNGNAE
jgi:deoxycytidylate deaminase